MELQFFGANCIKISTKKANLIVDDNLADLGQKSIIKPGDIALFTDAKSKYNNEKAKLVINTPGEYEVSNVSIRGIPVRSHMDEEGQHSSIIYKIIHGDINTVVLGHIYPSLTEEELEGIGTVDVLFVPVGGHGYTLDAVGALKTIKQIEPRIIIPTHYEQPGIKYEVPQTKLDDVLKEITFEVKDRLQKLKVKSNDLPENSQLIVLEKQ